MRVMVDANIIVSAILFPKSVIASVLKHLIDNYSLVLSKYTITKHRINYLLLTGSIIKNTQI
jgi:predicted nucleic acid-binding protein